MKMAVIGTGGVGQTIGSKLVKLGHEVMMGSRDTTNEKGLAWVKATGERASLGTFADAARFGELAFNCTAGTGSIPALTAAAEGLSGKIVVDLTNPLDFSKGMPPSLFTSTSDSLGEQAQKLLPTSHVVKALNHVTASVMVDPEQVGGGAHDALICGNDAGAKARVTELLKAFGWQSVIDLGDITASRALEHYLALWLRLMLSLGTAQFSLKVVK
jgi:predicted dinucleotide-binding enzyme